MATVASFFELSQLSEAAYASLVDNNGAPLFGQGFIAALIAEGMSTPQATDFVSHWAVVDHLPNTGSGFSATVFRRIDDDPVSGYRAGDLVFALRGTEQLGLDLFQTDIREIASNGLAFRQIVDMYNYWQRLITPATDYARQAILVPADATTPSNQVITEGVLGVRWTIDFVQATAGLGKVSATDSLVAATGHSLGGHRSGPIP